MKKWKGAMGEMPGAILAVGRGACYFPWKHGSQATMQLTSSAWSEDGGKVTTGTERKKACVLRWRYFFRGIIIGKPFYKRWQKLKHWVEIIHLKMAKRKNIHNSN